MAHFHLTHSRTRERTSDYTTYCSNPPNCNHSDYPEDPESGQDDYPYSYPHRPLRISRGLTNNHTQSSQLERFNVWPDKYMSYASSPEDEQNSTSSEHRKPYTSCVHRHANNTDVYDPEERDFELKLRAEFSSGPVSEFYRRRENRYEGARFWSAESLRRREQWVADEWEEVRGRSVSREREGGNSVRRSSEEREKSWSRYRRVKSTTTEEVVPLSGRRKRIVFEF